MITGVAVHTSEQLRALSASDRLVVLEMWEEARKGRKFNEDRFVEDTAESLCVHPRGVRRVISEAVRQIEQKIAIAGLTRGQRIADAAGATIEKVMATLEEALEAQTFMVLKDKDGPILDEHGKIQMIGVPNHVARVRAASELAAIHGVYAPKAVEVTGEVSHIHKAQSLTSEQLNERMRKLLADIEANGKIIDMPVERKQIEEGLVG